MEIQLAKAELRELDSDFAQEIRPENNLVVQFNPETLKVTFANQIATPSGAGDQRGPAARQFVGAGTTKLTAQLWFDVTAPQASPSAAADDVRKLTQKVAYFITPRQDDDHFVPPAVRFLWGSFQFDGLMDSMDESLELFSAEGKPLRANVSIALSQQKIQAFVFAPTGAGGSPKPPGASGTPGGAPAGTSPMTPAPAGSTLQGLVAAQVGGGADWQPIATANGIENPRLLQPGQLIDLKAGR